MSMCIYIYIYTYTCISMSSCGWPPCGKAPGNRKIHLAASYQKPRCHRTKHLCKGRSEWRHQVLGEWVPVSLQCIKIVSPWSNANTGFARHPCWVRLISSTVSCLGFASTGQTGQDNPESIGGCSCGTFVSLQGCISRYTVLAKASLQPPSLQNVAEAWDTCVVFLPRTEAQRDQATCSVDLQHLECLGEICNGGCRVRHAWLPAGRPRSILLRRHMPAPRSSDGDQAIAVSNFGRVPCRKGGSFCLLRTRSPCLQGWCGDLSCGRSQWPFARPSLVFLLL